MAYHYEKKLARLIIFANKLEGLSLAICVTLIPVLDFSVFSQIILIKSTIYIRVVRNDSDSSLSGGYVVKKIISKVFHIFFLE